MEHEVLALETTLPVEVGLNIAQLDCYRSSDVSQISVHDRHDLGDVYLVRRSGQV
jgi:hypothetical protein